MAGRGVGSGAEGKETVKLLHFDGSYRKLHQITSRMSPHSRDSWREEKNRVKHARALSFFSKKASLRVTQKMIRQYRVDDGQATMQRMVSNGFPND